MAGEEGADKIVQYFQTMIVTMKLYHWSTRSHARHLATDTLVDELLKNTDRLIEVYIGRYARPSYPRGLSLHIEQLNDESAVEALHLYGNWLKTDFSRYVKPHDTDIMNIRDEILGDIHRAMYRYTLM